jgi:hypothetical protein
MKITLHIYYGGSEQKAPTGATTSSQTIAPWAPMQPYLKAGYAEAAKLYSQGPQQYTPWSQVANLNGNQLAQINGVNDYVNSASTQQMLSNGSNAVQNLMTGANNPYTPITDQTNPALAGYLGNNNLNDVSQGLNHFMYSDLSDPMLQNTISAAGQQADGAFGDIRNSVQNKFGIGQNIAQNSADISKTNTTNAALGAAFDNQNSNRLSAINMANAFNNGRFGLAADLVNKGGDYANNAMNLGFQNYSSMIQQPLTLLNELNRMGGIRQTNNQAQLTDATNRWNFNQNAAFDLLNKFGAMVNPNASWGNVYTGNNAMSQTGSAGNAYSNAIGAATSAAALYNASQNGK